MALVGIKLCHIGTHHVIFLCFSKDKSPKLWCHLEQRNYYLDLDQAYATHEFQVQSKSLYQNNLIQNSGEFKAEN